MQKLAFLRTFCFYIILPLLATKLFVGLFLINREMRKYVFLSLFLLLCCSCGEFVETKDVTHLTPFSADVAIKVRCEDYQEAGILYYLAAKYGVYHPYSIAWNESQHTDGNQSRRKKENVMNVHISHLSPSTRYYYRSYVIRDGRLYCGEMSKFTTHPYSVDFSVGKPANISYCSAEIELSATGDEECPIDYVGFVCSRFHDNIIHAKGQQTSLKVAADSVAVGAEVSGESSVFRKVKINDLNSGTIYYYCPFASHDGHYAYGPICTFTTSSFHLEAVDLGLSVLWASCNVGASGPDGRGSWFSWGETEEKEFYTEKYYDMLDCFERMTVRGGFVPVYIVPAENICGTELDAATVNWGDGWRLPTDDEMRELMDNCRWTPEIFRRQFGMRVTGFSGNNVFIPFSSRRGPEVLMDEYWSGIVSYDKPLYEGRSIRAVKDKLPEGCPRENRDNNNK